MYKKKIIERNQVQVYDAYDDSAFTEQITDNRCQFLDFTVPIYHLPKYNWIVSLNVTKHIPKQFDRIFLDNIAFHAQEGVILGWASQEGSSHNHNQDQSYLAHQMKLRGLKLNKKLSRDIKEIATFDWLRDNLNIYERI